MSTAARLSLPAKILLLAGLNLALLAALAMIVGGVRVPLDLEAFFGATAGERIVNVSRTLALELQDTPADALDRLLARYSATYGATFVLVRNDGSKIAGEVPAIPEQVVERLRRAPALGLPPPPEAGPPQPSGPPRGERPRPVPSPPPFLVRADGALRYWVGVRIPIRHASSLDTIPGTLLIGSSRFFGNPFLFQPGPWIALALAGIVLTILCWAPFLRGITRSIAQMERATTRIAEGRFDVVVPSGRADELGRLGASINRMAARLETMVTGQRRFLGDTAHELRSPLGRMQVALEILDGRLGPDDRRYVRDLKEDAGAMTRLTDDLLQFARAELASQSGRLVATNVRDAVQRAVRLESRAGEDIRVDVAADLQVVADPDYLVRSLANVLRNALRYAADGGPVTVAAEVKDRSVTITVSDCGPGIPSEALERIFTPFYRLDPSRDRRTGGVGLGLAIVRSSIEACHGSVVCRNREPSGLEVRISLPGVTSSAV